ncbi:secreted RxLR effector protein 161-like [Castanea sativa]|uniref:secreted RxLR effector protein 161-like n=1 Tax=Castanea sativa TaxID=21020 RepID=UPI003F649B23
MNDVWTLVPRPKGEHIIGTKWNFRNKIDEEGNVILNKAHLVAQGYPQMEGVDYDETFSLVAHPSARDRSMISSLMYLTASRPDISYNVGMCARYQANPKESHMNALKRILKYVKTTANFGVWCSKETKDVLVGYSDADWAGNADDRRSTSGGCFYVGHNLASWMSKKQNSIS